MKKLFPVLILSAAMLLLAACTTPTPQPAAETAEPQPEVLIIAGRVQPVNAMEQSFSIPGQIIQVMVNEGDQVEAGQVLARMSTTPEAQLALARAKQELLSAQQALDALEDTADVNRSQAKLARIAAEEALEKAQERYEADETEANLLLWEDAKVQLVEAHKLEEKLARGNGVDPDQKAALEARFDTARTALASAQEAVDAAELKSTMAGTVVDVQFQAGQKVTAGQTVFMVADFSSWVVKTDNLTEVDVVNVEVGQKVEIVLDALPGETMSGEVTGIDLLYEEKRGDITYTVTAKLAQSSPKMRWGMTAAVAFLP